MSLVTGALPAGVTLGSNCTLSGTPGAAGGCTFTVRINDQGGSVVTVALGRGRIAPPEFVGNARRRG